LQLIQRKRTFDRRNGWSPAVGKEVSIGGVWGVSVLTITAFIYFALGKYTIWQSLYIGVFWPLWLFQSWLFKGMGGC
jgi:hypothetical protein